MQTTSQSSIAVIAPELSDDKTERGRLILAAALDLLEEEGLEGLTIRSMLKRTGLARRAFYDRFAGKDDLVLAVFESTLSEGAYYFAEAIASVDDPVERMRHIVTGLVLGGPGRAGMEIEMNDKRSAALSREHLRLAESRPAELQRALRPLLGLIASQVTEGIRLGQFRDCDPDLQATLIFNLVATMLHTELLTHQDGKPDRGRRQKLADEVWEFCRRAIIA